MLAPECGSHLPPAMPFSSCLPRALPPVPAEAGGWLAFMSAADKQADDDILTSLWEAASKRGGDASADFLPEASMDSPDPAAPDWSIARQFLDIEAASDHASGSGSEEGDPYWSDCGAS